MPSPLVTATLQAAGLSALSNILAQLLNWYTADKPFVLDITQLLQFVVFTLISCPPNIKWQQYLEHVFPGQVPAQPPTGKDTEKKEVFVDGKKKFSVANTAKKFILDQTLASFVNTSAFIIGMGLLKGRAFSTIAQDWTNDFWPITTSGLKLWPAVSLFNFAMVPVEKRVIVGGIVGIGWGIYLSLMAA